MRDIFAQRTKQNARICTRRYPHKNNFGILVLAYFCINVLNRGFNVGGNALNSPMITTPKVVHIKKQITITVQGCYKIQKFKGQLFPPFLYHASKTTNEGRISFYLRQFSTIRHYIFVLYMFATQNFAMVNGCLLLFGIMQYNLIQTCNTFFPFTFFPFYAKNYALMAFVDYGVSNKPSIHLNLDTTLNLKGNTLEFHWYVLTSTAVETLTHLCVVNHHAFCERHLLQDVLWFVPISFVFEILFDLFHYTTHRLLHSPHLYKYCHKTHHKFKHPTSIITFYQEPLDLIMTNSIPTLLTLTILAKYVSYRQFHMILIYKTFIEICGHCGKYSYPTCSFPQFVWLPKWLHIELYTEDHDLHHSLNNCNYAKRFSLWDKVFHTYKPNEKIERTERK